MFCNFSDFFDKIFDRYYETDFSNQTLNSRNFTFHIFLTRIFLTLLNFLWKLTDEMEDWSSCHFLKFLVVSNKDLSEEISK